MVEHWNSDGGIVWWNSATVMVEQCGGTVLVEQCCRTVEQLWWNSVGGTGW